MTIASPTNEYQQQTIRTKSNPFLDIHDQARSFMAEHGFIYDGDFPETSEGTQEKFNGEDGSKEKRSWLKCYYSENENGLPLLRITFNRFDGVSSKITRTFRSDDPLWNSMSEQEKNEIRKSREEQKTKSLKIAENEKRIANELADKVIDRLSKAKKTPPNDAVTYFSKKGLQNISDHGNIFWEVYEDYSSGSQNECWVALVALRNGKGNIRALQELWPEKMIFSSGSPRNKNYIGKVGDLSFVYGKLENGSDIQVTEGVATTITAFQSTNKTTVAAMDCGNLHKVVKDLRRKYPKSSITICADNDHHTEIDDKGNPGIDHARKTALEFDCKIAIPKFSEDNLFDKFGNPRTDFDDLRQLSGLEIVKEQIENAFEPEASADDMFIVLQGEIYKAVDMAERIIRTKQLGIYQRKGQLVRIIMAGDKSKNRVSGRDPQTLIITEADQNYIEEVLTKEGNWGKYDDRTKTVKRTDCPQKAVKMLRSRMEWNLNELHAVIRCPTIRRNGSILQIPGYDVESGLYFHNDGVVFPKISDKPSRDDAVACLENLKKIYNGFPFENEASLSVAIASVLTALVRRSISSAPIFAFTAPKMGSGKSLLAEMVSLIVTGKRMTAIPQAENEAEERKRLLAVLMEGDPIITYDNIEEDFGSAALCSVITQSEFKDRILGSSKSATASTDATFLLTGNNLVFRGDITTRVILCKINPEVERPEEREFDIDLKNYIPTHRGLLVHAGLTILKSYLVAGSPKQDIRQFGRFEEWSDWIRSSLVWLGMEDPCNTRNAIESDDPVRNDLINFLNAWFTVAADNVPRIIKDIINKVTPPLGKNDDSLTTIYEAFLAVAGNPKQPNVICSKRLGKYLSKHKGRIEGGLRIEQIGEHKKQLMWAVKRPKS